MTQGAFTVQGIINRQLDIEKLFLRELDTFFSVSGFSGALIQH